MSPHGTVTQRQGRQPSVGASKRDNTNQSRPSEVSGIGARIRFMRGQRGMTLETLAAASGLTKSFVSKVERSRAVPSISTAMKLAESFGITVGQLLGEDHDSDAVCLVRKNERRAFMRPGSTVGYNYELVAGSKRFKRMEPYVMKPPVRFQDDRLFEHVGEEFMFVLSGHVEVTLAGQKIALGAGDALYFDSHLPHRSRSLGRRNAEVLVVIFGMEQKPHALRRAPASARRKGPSPARNARRGR